MNQQPSCIYRNPIVICALTLSSPGLFSCGPDFDSLETNSTRSFAAPAGSGATLSNNGFPTSLIAGERMSASATYTNTGASSPDNDWDSTYLLLPSSSDITWSAKSVNGTVTANAGQTFTFYVRIDTPSTPSTYNVGYQMFAAGADSGFFGDIGVRSITVSASGTKHWECTDASNTTLPASMTPGQVASIDIEVTNSGSETWASGDVCLYPRDSSVTQWGSQTCVTNTSPVAAGANYTFTLSITAPQTATSYTFHRQMFQVTPSNSGGIGLFDESNNCFERTVTVTGTALLDSEFDAANSDLDENISMVPNETRTVTAAFTNTGSETWLASDDYYLYSLNSPSTLWGSVLAKGPLSGDVAPSGTGTFTFTVTAPGTEADYTSAWQLYNGAEARFFGETTNITVNVSNSNPSQYGATVVSQTIPSTATRLRTTEFQVTMQNSGTAAWSGSNFRLRSANSPFSLWGLAETALGDGETINPGESKVFTFDVQAPSAVGTYNSVWQMDYNSLNGGVGYFGDQATTSVSVVNLCGNGTFDAGEECDDGNETDGDACSNSCVINPQVITVGPSSAAGRTFYGPWDARNFTKVAIGDVTGDGIKDVILGGEATVRPTGRPLRDRAGAIYGFAGGTSFFTNGFTNADTADFTFYGARAYDLFAGLSEGAIKTGDVTGDGVDDIIVSATNAACADGTGQCGRVYVINGTSLSSTPYDLLSLASPVVASLVSPNSGDGAVVAAVGDVTGDGVDDIAVGMPYRDDAASNAGAIVLVQGGGTLTGTITLSGGSILAEILGDGADTRIGYRAEIGQLNGSGNNDILISSPGYDSSTGGSNAGAVWAVFDSSITGTVNLSTTYNARWLGAGIRDQLGKDIAIADVTGASNPDVIIGVAGHRIASVRYGAVNIFAGPIADGTDIDYSSDPIPLNVEVLARDPSDYVGWCLATGDINGNGETDIIAGGPLSGGSTNGLSQAGDVIGILGGSNFVDLTLSASDPITLVSSEAVSRACYYISSLAAGDLDNDGDDDFCVGFYRSEVSSSGLSRPGKVDCVASPF